VCREKLNYNYQILLSFSLYPILLSFSLYPIRRENSEKNIKLSTYLRHPISNLLNTTVLRESHNIDFHAIARAENRGFFDVIQSAKVLDDLSPMRFWNGKLLTHLNGSSVNVQPYANNATLFLRIS